MSETGTVVEKPGVYDIPEAEYHADICVEPSLSSSVAKLFIDASPMHVRNAHPRLNPEYQPKKSALLDLGSLCHELVLGKGAGIDVCEAKDWKTKAAQAFRKESIANGRTPVTEPMMENGERVAAAFKQQYDFPPGEAELTWVHKDEHGLWTRARTDWATLDGLVFDYKGTKGSAHPDSCIQTAERMSYDFQQAFYERVICGVKPELAGRLEFVFLFQELNPPYAVCPIELTEADLSIARRQVIHALSQWNYCNTLKTWPGYGRHRRIKAMRPWHTQAWLDRELEMEDE